MASIVKQFSFHQIPCDDGEPVRESNKDSAAVGEYLNELLGFLNEEPDRQDEAMPLYSPQRANELIRNA